MMQLGWRRCCSTWTGCWSIPSRSGSRPRPRSWSGSAGRGPSRTRRRCWAGPWSGRSATYPRGGPPPGPPPPAAVERWLIEGMLSRTKAGRVTVLPGAPELLAEVAAAGLPYALVTGSLRPFVEAVLAATGFRFPVTVCGDDVPVTKPDPAPYQLAAKLLDVAPARTVALEDSPNGVASATGAGCLVVAVPSIAAVPAAPGRLVVRSLSDVTLGTLRALASANA